MSSLDEMTKQELLDHARALDISPANNDMTKDELRAAIDAAAGEATVVAAAGDEPEIGLQMTSTMTKDYLNRALFNPTPGTSNATDYLGRAVTSGNKDYMARNLVA